MQEPGHTWYYAMLYRILASALSLFPLPRELSSGHIEVSVDV